MCNEHKLQETEMAYVLAKIISDRAFAGNKAKVALRVAEDRLMVTMQTLAELKRLRL